MDNLSPYAFTLNRPWSFSPLPMAHSIQISSYHSSSAYPDTSSQIEQPSRSSSFKFSNYAAGTRQICMRLGTAGDRTSKPTCMFICSETNSCQDGSRLPLRTSLRHMIRTPHSFLVSNLDLSWGPLERYALYVAYNQNTILHPA